ncbi:MAG: 1-acyl-sn-glycerol-3-phosphate acyltransferase [Planctomycetota bacterium]|nr:1-acyl-sn-glycerol-3-phosphate acyltransferase [Planctomycetota bacterium]
MQSRFVNLLSILVRKFAHHVIKRYYPRIQITGAERIPKTGPVLFCANHPNSLVDPILIGIAARRPVSFMAKAPLFKTPLLGPIINALGMVPAYRGRDDARQVKKNSASLALVAKGLKAGRAMGIFPEGVSSDKRQLGMVRSGAARIALEAFENGVTDLIIIPLGINYDKKEQLGSKVWINVGQPLDLASWIPEHSKDNEEPIAPSDDKRLRRKLTEELGIALKSVIVHLDNADWDPLLTDLETIFKRTKHKPSDEVPALMRRKRIADAVNYYYEQDPATANEIIGKVESYHRELRSAGLVIDDPILNRSRTYAIFTFLWQLGVLVLWFLPALFGSMMNMVPFLITRKVAAKFQDDGQKTIATWRLVCGIPIYLIWYGIIYMTVFYETEQLPMAMMMNFMLPITGSIALRYWPFFAKSMRHMGHQFRTLTNRKQLHDLREKLAGIRVTLIEYAEKYAEISPRPEKTPTVRPFMMLFAKAIGTACFLAIAVVIYIYAVNLVSSQFAPQTRVTNPLASKSSEEVHESQVAATKELITIEKAYRNTLNKARELLAGYRAGNVHIEKQQDSDQIQSLLRRYCTYRDNLLRISLNYRPYQDASLFDNQQSQDRALFLFVAATLLRHEMSANFIEAHDDLPRVRKLLNLPETHWGIPAGVFYSVQRELLDTTYQDMIFAAETAYLQLGRSAAKDSPLHNMIEKSQAEIAGIPEFGIRASVNRALRDAKDNATGLYQHINAFTGTVIGDFQVNQRGIDHPIRPDDLHGFHQALKPGDILIERRNWYASNAFLPGFWPHGAMYVGTVQEMKDAGIYKLVRKAIREFANDEAATENEISQAHAQHLRDILDEFERPKANNRYEHHHVIEAVSEGVILNTIEHSAGEATSVCAFRPVLLSKEQIAKAVASAYKYLGREYDFDFDFETPNTLVCTEVVYRCYEGNRENYPLQFKLSNILGTQTLPAQNIVKSYVDAVQRNDPKNQLQLVAWIDTDRHTTPTSTLMVFNGSTTGPDHTLFEETLQRPGLTWEWERRQHGLRALITRPTEYLFYLCFSTTVGAALYQVTIRRRRRKRAELNQL